MRIFRGKNGGDLGPIYFKFNTSPAFMSDSQMSENYQETLGNQLLSARKILVGECGTFQNDNASAYTFNSTSQPLRLAMVSVSNWSTLSFKQNITENVRRIRKRFSLIKKLKFATVKPRSERN